MEKLTVSLEIENAYELYDNETTYVVDQVVDAPADHDEDTLRVWAEDALLPFTGVGHFDGDSWYDVTVTACSDPKLVGERFEFGY